MGIFHIKDHEDGPKERPMTGSSDALVELLCAMRSMSRSSLHRGDNGIHEHEEEHTKLTGVLCANDQGVLQLRNDETGERLDVITPQGPLRRSLESMRGHRVHCSGIVHSRRNGIAPSVRICAVFESSDVGDRTGESDHGIGFDPGI